MSEQLELPFMDTDPWLDERDLSDIIREDQETFGVVIETPVNPIDVVLDDHTGEVLDILNPGGIYTECAYLAIPIEAMDKLETDLSLLKGLISVGQTDKAYRFIALLEEELFDKTKEV